MRTNTGTTPLYCQMYELFVNKIVTQEWPEGSRIPREADLCAEYGISRITIRQALARMKSEGLLTSRQGKGTFVEPRHIEKNLDALYSFSDQEMQPGRKPRSVLLSFSIQRAQPKIAEKLRVPVHTAVYRIVRLRCLEEQPFAYETSYVPVHLIPELKAGDVEGRGLYQSMRLLGNCDPDAATETFSAAALEPKIAQQLRCEPHAPALQIERIATRRETVVEYCSSVAKGDSIRYQVTLKK